MMNHMKTLSLHKKAGWMMLLASCLLFPYSCADETIVEQEQIRPDDAIAFSVADSDSWQSVVTDENKSRIVPEFNKHFLGMMGKDSLFVSLLVEENDIPLSSEKEGGVSSRGASYSSENPLTSFQVKAILDNGGEFMNTTMTWDGSKSAWTYSPVKYWPQNNAVHFLGYAKSLEEYGTLANLSLASSAEGVGSASFSYTLPDAVTDGDDKWKDAQNQPDLLFAFLPNKTKQAVNVPLQFALKHALSAVVFKEGTVPSEVVIDKVTFTKVYSQASCDLGETGFIWKDWDKKATFAQTFVKPVGENISTASDETCFMMIPQSFEEDAEFTINLKVTSKNPADNGATNRTNTYHFTKKLKDFGTWEANKKYTFVISSAEEVEVKVSDRVSTDGSEKDQLDIRNTGLSPAYIRVDIRGSWLLPKDPNDNDSYDRIVADWDPTKDGTFEGTGNQANTLTPGKWYKHTDGFYYYLEVVDAGQSAPKLFEKYILNTTPPVAGAELDLVIKAQAVLPADVEMVWPAEITNEIE